MIYFILAPEVNLVKIGVASEPWSRLSKIQSDSPCKLEVLSICEGEAADERALHERFAADRVRGEWFSYSDAIRAHVATLPAAVRAMPPRAARIGNFASAAGISPAYASMILSGKRKPGLKRLVSIYRLTGERLGKLAALPDGDLETLARIYGAAA